MIPFFDGASKTPTIRIITKDGQPVRDLVRLKPGERIHGLTWSPDGEWIYFGLGAQTETELRRVPVSGGPVTDTGLRTSMWPDFVVHPKGTHLAFLKRAPTEMWRVDGVRVALARLEQKQ